MTLKEENDQCSNINDRNFKVIKEKNGLAYNRTISRTLMDLYGQALSLHCSLL